MIPITAIANGLFAVAKMYGVDKMIAGKVGEFISPKTATKVVGIATALTGEPDAEKAMEVISNDPEKGQKFADELTARRVEMEALRNEDRENERLLLAKRDENWLENQKAIAAENHPWSWIRPMCALISTVTLSLIAIGVIAALVSASWSGKADVITGIQNSWVQIIAISAPLLWIVQSFFVKRQEYKKIRSNASIGVPVEEGGITAILKMIQGKK